LSTSYPQCESGNEISLFPRFKTTLDKYDIHRGLGAYIPPTTDPPTTETSGYDEIINFLSPHFGSFIDIDGKEKLPENVYVVVICNDANLAGAANIPRRITYVTGANIRNSTDITTSTYFPNYYISNKDGAVGSHEFAHIFGKLQDEYWFPCVENTVEWGDCANYHNAPNRFNPTTETIGEKWEHWLGLEGIGANYNIYGLSGGNCTQSPNWDASSGTTIYKAPRNYGLCFMGTLGVQNFCAVCREAIVERVHTLVNPINSFLPSNNSGNVFNLSSSQNYEVNLTIPVRTDLTNNYNSMVVNWSILSEDLSTVYETLQQTSPTVTPVNPSSAIYKFTDETHQSICDWFAGRQAGNYRIKVEVYDRAGNSEDVIDNSRWVRDPDHAVHKYETNWLVYYSGIPGTNLYTSDVDSDLGVEPNTQSDVLWESPDIWVTNADNPNGTEHENPEYVATPDVFSYVHVKVKNRGCKVYTPVTNDGVQMKVYWAKAGTALDWPASWNGSFFTSDPTLLRGDLIGSAVIGTVDITTGATPVVLNWDVPNPTPYATIFDANELSHFCILSRIDAPTAIDPITNEISTGLWTVAHNVKENNNIAWKNFTIVEELSSYVGNTYTDDKETGTSIIVENPTTQSQTIRLKFEVPTNETGKSIVDEAEVRVILDPALWTKWVNGGQVVSNITVYNASRRQLLLTNETAYLGNIQLNSNDAHTMYVSYNFLTEELTTKTEFKLRAIQVYDTTPNAVIGGETYIIRPDRNRQSFTANAGGDKEIILGNNYQGIARGIGETAIFNWYDVSTGTKLYTGGTFNVTANNVGTKTYKLETIAQSDGYKDYNVVNVTTILGKIISVAPNPANSGTFAINYSVANSVTTAKIKVININNNVFTENTISTGNGTLNLNVSNYANGSYSIVLICDNQSADSELFVVN